MAVQVTNRFHVKCLVRTVSGTTKRHAVRLARDPLNEGAIDT